MGEGLWFCRLVVVVGEHNGLSLVVCMVEELWFCKLAACKWWFYRWLVVARMEHVWLLAEHKERGCLVERKEHGWLMGTSLENQFVHQFHMDFCVVVELVVVDELVVA
jgi:hypothetical protein